jgi:hypothetical protein
MTKKNIPVNNTPAEITEIMPKSFRLGDSSLKAKANRRRNIGAADLHCKWKKHMHIIRQVSPCFTRKFQRSCIDLP